MVDHKVENIVLNNVYYFLLHIIENNFLVYLINFLDSHKTFHHKYFRIKSAI